MDTLEARNLNRLRKGKMMLAFGKEKKSFGVAFLLTLIGGWLGAHRFYLGHKLIGAAFLITLALFFVGSVLADDDHTWILIFVLTIPYLLTTVVIIELILSFWVVGRENGRIKSRLAEEFDVQDFRVSK